MRLKRVVVLNIGDVLVVWRLDRLGRSRKDLIEMVETLSNRGIELQSLCEAIATDSSSGKLIFHAHIENDCI